MIYVNGRFLTQILTGSQRFAYEMLRSLVTNFKDKITILMPHGEIKPGYEVTGFPIKVIGTRTTALWEQIDLPLHLVKNGKPILINLVNTAPVFYENQIVSIMDMTTFVNPKWFTKAFSLYYRLLVPIIARRSKKILTISESSKSDIIKYVHIDEQKIQILHCSVSDEYLNPTINGEENKAVLKKFNIKKNQYLLAVSSLDPRKNFVQLVKAYSQLDSDIPLVIVGSQGKIFANDQLKQLLVKSENVILTGYISNKELMHLYSSAICFVYPSLYEGFGMPPLEAMACGCPTIVSNTSSLPEVCGSASIYVDPHDLFSIRTAIQQVINSEDLRVRLISLGTDQVKKFSWKKSGEILAHTINFLE